MRRALRGLPLVALCLGLGATACFGDRSVEGTGGHTTWAGGTAGGDAGAGGGGGDAVDAGAVDGAAGAPWPPETCISPINGISAQSFCAYYEQKCAAQYGTGVAEYANMGDCLNKYSNFTANSDPASTMAQNKKGCVAYHLCVAGTFTPGDSMHCLHAAGGACAPP